MSDSRLTPVAFDIETSGFDADAVITVAGRRLGVSADRFKSEDLIDLTDE